MLDFLRRLRRPKYDSLNRIEIDAKNIVDNYNILKDLQKEAEIFPVLKSNAYGHGLKETCQILNQTAAKMVVVDSYPEAQIAYKYFKGKVLILGEMPLKAYKYAKLKRTEFVVYNESTLRYLSRYGKKTKIHLFVNTGMNREGIKDINAFIEENKKYLDKVSINGLCSHFAVADGRSILNSSQEDKLMDDLTILRSAGYFPKWVHIGNSAAVFWNDNKLLTAFRPGLAVYGYCSLSKEDENTKKLKPALEAYSQVVSLQEVEVGETVSYGEDFKADKATQIAVMPFGYFEGLDRRLSNKAKFVIYGNEPFDAQVAGRVCMNLTCLDAGAENVQIGDEVQVISKNNEDLNSVENIASIMDTIPYEFLVALDRNMRRFIINYADIKEKKGSKKEA